MIGTNWIKNLLRRIMSKGSEPYRYWELEGLCKIETAPPVIVRGVFAGPTLTSAARQYCVRR